LALLWAESTECIDGTVWNVVLPHYFSIVLDDFRSEMGKLEKRVVSLPESLHKVLLKLNY